MTGEVGKAAGQACHTLGAKDASGNASKEAKACCAGDTTLWLGFGLLLQVTAMLLEHNSSPCTRTGVIIALIAIPASACVDPLPAPVTNRPAAAGLLPGAAVAHTVSATRALQTPQSQRPKQGPTPGPVQGTPARVVVLSSLAHQLGSMRLDDLHRRGRRYSGLGQYADSKLANALFAKELARR